MSSWLTFLLDIKVAFHCPLAGWSVILVGRFHSLHQPLYLLSSTFKIIPCLKQIETTISFIVSYQFWGTSSLKFKTASGAMDNLDSLSTIQPHPWLICWVLWWFWIALVKHDLLHVSLNLCGMCRCIFDCYFLL